MIYGVGLNPATAEAKVPQNAVSYQDKPKDTQRCDGGKNFQSPNACKMVEGEISPQGWCYLFTKKPWEPEPFAHARSRRSVLSSLSTRQDAPKCPKAQVAVFVCVTSSTK